MGLAGDEPGVSPRGARTVGIRSLAPTPSTTVTRHVDVYASHALTRLTFCVSCTETTTQWRRNMSGTDATQDQIWTVGPHYCPVP